MRAIGDSRTPLLLLVVACGLNIGLVLLPVLGMLAMQVRRNPLGTRHPDRIRRGVTQAPTPA